MNGTRLDIYLSPEGYQESTKEKSHKGTQFRPQKLQTTPELYSSSAPVHAALLSTNGVGEAFVGVSRRLSGKRTLVHVSKATITH